MKIEIRKFGTILISRQLGREALAAFLPNLAELPDTEKIEVDFSGVEVFSPSWGDEFLTPLHQRFGKRLSLAHSDNSSVQETVKMLERANSISFNYLP